MAEHQGKASIAWMLVTMMLIIVVVHNVSRDILYSKPMKFHSSTHRRIVEEKLPLYIFVFLDERTFHPMVMMIICHLLMVNLSKVCSLRVAIKPNGCYSLATSFIVFIIVEGVRELINNRRSMPNDKMSVRKTITI